MKKKLKMLLVVSILIAFSICITLFIIYKVKLYNANNRAKDIVIQDNMEVLEDNRKIITEDDNIGTLTIPAILLENAPINEGIELSTLSHSIGHFPFSSIYDGNVCLASHNRGSSADYFKNLYKLKIGDKIYYQSIFGTKRYMVESINTIQETDFSYIGQTYDNKITLITCISNKPDLRLCVQAKEF